MGSLKLNSLLLDSGEYPLAACLSQHAFLTLPHLPSSQTPSLVVDHLLNTTWDKKNFDLQGLTRWSLLVKVWFNSIQCFKIGPVPSFSEESKKNIRSILSEFRLVSLY